MNLTTCVATILDFLNHRVRSATLKTAICAAAVVALGNSANADLVITNYEIEVTLIGTSGDMLISGAVQQSTSGGGIAGYTFIGDSESSIATSNFYTLTAEAGYDVLPKTTQKLTFDFDNTAGTTDATATFRIEGLINMDVINATSGDDLEGRAFISWDNLTGLEGLNFFNEIVNTDASFQEDFPIQSEWTVTLAAGQTGTLDIITGRPVVIRRNELFGFDRKILRQKKCVANKVCKCFCRQMFLSGIYPLEILTQTFGQGHKC